MSAPPEEPADVMGDEPEEPTDVIKDEPERPTERLEHETAQTEQVEGGGGDDSRRRGIWMLVASIAAGLILVGVYIAAGGLDYKPGGGADPCDAREWTDPGNFEEAAQQFALSAIDGAACGLGVSREELTRALADEQSRNAFAEKHDLSDEQIEEAVRSGLNRAIDDAEDAGAINGLAVTGLRAAVRIMPLDQLIELATDAPAILNSGRVNDLGDLIEGVTGTLDGGDSGATGAAGPTGDTGDSSITDGLDQFEQDLRDRLPDEVEKNVPDDLRQRLEDELNSLLNP